MRHSLRVCTPAHRDTARQARYLAARNVRAARRFLAAVALTYRRIRSTPDIGDLWREETDDAPIRCCSVRGFESYVIYYRNDGDILIARILHGRRDQAAAWSE